MFAMFRKVSAREVVVGWYSTGPKLRKSDIDIHQIFTKYLPHPVYVIVDVKPKQVGIPTEAYYCIEEKPDEKSQPTLTFAHLPSEIGALEAEEIGVEHLLRDVKDTTVSDLATSVSARMNSLQALHSRLTDIHKYLDSVTKKELPINHNILYLLQDVFNLLPGLQEKETKEAFTVQVNDSMLAMYVSSLTKSIISLHELVNNKIDLRDAELKEIKDQPKKLDKKKKKEDVVTEEKK
jgi:26S proteasome regulatory subunit N8